MTGASLLAFAAGMAMMLWAEAPARRVREDPRVGAGELTVAIVVGVLAAALTVAAWR